MSSTTTTTITINQLNTAAATIVLVVAFINLTLSAFGLIFNILIFTRRSLRRESCSLYFFWSSCFDLSINANIRRMSSLKTTKRAIIITIVTIMLLYSHMLIYFQITNVSNQFGNTVPTCNAQKGIYRTFLSFWYMALYSLCPSLLMLLFGILTLNNLRQHRQIVPTTSGTNQIVRRTDNQFLRMLIAQVLMIIIATLPYSIYQLYAAFTSHLVKNTLRIAQENLAVRITGFVDEFCSHN
ncbi:unnamed protein product [Adineta steineri]|uniref:G-protein coupled receptors family 1 profile domain-containing protein n=1 Tax=Adineta steineri TaxID=433720 RepID=A0A813ZMV3_9BILA|nr:unnamed protein product [Adineta steineri]CAF4076872.1 unnamed protein product [Adineta steineri]